MGRLEDAKAIQKTDPAKAEAQYKSILSIRPETTDAALKEYELALMALGELYRDAGYAFPPMDGPWWDGNS
jgi:26S proteasome regulatory subunit N6